MRLRDPIPFAFALAVAIVAMSVPLRAQQDNGLPPGDGRDIVAVACSQCHGLNAITQLREGRTAWRHQVDDMIERGAQISPGEIDTVVNYLATRFGPGAPFPNQTPDHVALPPGNGADIVQAQCSVCHGVSRVVAVKRSKSGWTAIVGRMTYLGAALTPDQTKTVLDYLTANFGTAAAKSS